MFKKRLISGIILVLLALLFIISGGVVLYLVTLALSLIAAGELYRASKIIGKNPFNTLAVTGYIAIVGYYLAMLFLPTVYHLLVIVLGLIAIMFVYVFTYPKYHANQIVMAFFGIVYTGVMISCIYQTRMLPGGNYHVWLIFISAWGCDTCAYCVGMLLGKHKMAPVLSPKKSIEGAIGGLVGAIVLGIIFALIIHESILPYAIICGCGALISMVGDLGASAIKRNMEIKDYGTLIPGHGGILDRFDSIIFTAPVIYLLALALIK